MTDTDRDRAIAALKKAGFTQGHHDPTLWTRPVDRPSGSCIDVVYLQNDGLFEFQQAGRHADLPALLSPLTLEMVEQELRKMIRGAWLVPNLHTDEDGVIEVLRQRLRQQKGGEQDA